MSSLLEYRADRYARKADAALELFLARASSLSDAEYWIRVRELWTAGGASIADQSHWLPLLNSNRPGRAQHLMTLGDQLEFASLPDRLEIFRGEIQPKFYRRMSWTLEPT